MSTFKTGLALVTLLIATSSCCPAQDTQPVPFENRMVSALFNKQVQGSLELVEEQKQEMDQILESLKNKRNALSRELVELKDSGATELEIQAKREEFVADLENDKERTISDAMNVLLPHQQKRLRQTTVQVMMRESAKTKRVPSGLLTEEIREYLDIGDQQAERIKNKAMELQKKVAEQIKTITDQAKTELLSELTKQQQSKYEKLIGDPIQR